MFKNLEKSIENDNGFTLLEMLIVVALIGISLSMVTIAFNLIDQSNVKSYAEQYNTDLRMMKNDTMSSQGDVYFLQWLYDNTESQYYYQISQRYKTIDEVTGAEAIVIDIVKTVYINKAMMVELDKTGTDTYASVNTFLADEVKVEFEASSGKLVNVVDNNGAGVYKFTNSGSSTVATVTVIEETGRVFYDE